MARFLFLGWLQLHRIKESDITRLVMRIDNEEKLKFFWLGVCLNFENAVQALNNSLLIQGSFRPQWILGPCKVNLDLKQVFLPKFVSLSISRHCHKVLKFLFTERTVESHGTGVLLCTLECRCGSDSWAECTGQSSFSFTPATAPHLQSWDLKPCFSFSIPLSCQG